MSDDVVSAYTADLVSRLTGLTFGQLAYWDRTEFFKPQFARFGEGKTAVRIYSFKDVVGLRTLQILKSVHRVTLQHLRAVAAELSRYSKAPWSEIKLRVLNRHVHFDEPETGRTRDVLNKQYVLLAVIDVMEDIKRRSTDLSNRNEKHFGKYERNRNVSHNVEVISGTRIPVRAVKRYIEGGFSHAEILREYPRLISADIDAVARGIQKVA